MTPDALLPPEASVRQAALLLHGMTATDRTWLLDQLPLDQQEVLSTLLVELAELGVPADPAFVREAVAECAPEAPRTLERLSADQITALAEWLRPEPPALVAHLLAAGPWTWEADLLNALEAAKRRQVEACREAAQGTVRPDRLSAALVDAVSEQLWPPRGEGA